MSEMQDLVVTDETDVSILKGFYCGLRIMDEYIHDGRLQSHIDTHPCRFAVVRNQDNEILAMFVLSKGALQLDEDCIDDLKLKFQCAEKELDVLEWLDAGKFPSLEIDYLAVKQECRGSNLHIGRWVIQKILSYSQEFDNPLFVSVDAYTSKDYSAVGFYEKNLFLCAEFPCAQYDTIRMYRILEN